jgi:hypothetical protein
MTDKKFKLFNKLLLLYGHCSVENYRYVGGAYYSKNQTHYKYLLKLIDDYPELKNTIDYDDIDNASNNIYNCVCGHDIRQRCYIIRKDKPLTFDNFITIGNCCINIFYQNKNKRECSDCGGVHRNYKNNLCIECRNFKKRVEKIKKRLNEELINFKNKQKIQFLNCEYLFNRSFQIKILFGKYKDKNIYDFLGDKNYYNWLYNQCSDSVCCYLYNNLNTGFKIFSYIEYIDKVVLKFLHKMEPDYYPSDSIEFYARSIC